MKVRRRHPRPHPFYARDDAFPRTDQDTWVSESAVFGNTAEASPGIVPRPAAIAAQDRYTFRVTPPHPDAVGSTAVIACQPWRQSTRSRPACSRDPDRSHALRCPCATRASARSRAAIARLCALDAVTRVHARDIVATHPSSFRPEASRPVAVSRTRGFARMPRLASKEVSCPRVRPCLLPNAFLLRPED